MRGPDPSREAIVDATAWSGDGELTQRVMDVLRGEPRIAHVRVEDAPASRAEAEFGFISNELYVRFSGEQRREVGRVWGVVPIARRVVAPSLTLPALEAILSAHPGVGSPDYADEGMLQYLRTERIVPPYQARGYKLVELVRIYVAGPSEAR